MIAMQGHGGAFKATIPLITRTLTVPDTNAAIIGLDSNPSDGNKFLVDVMYVDGALKMAYGQRIFNV